MENLNIKSNFNNSSDQNQNINLEQIYWSIFKNKSLVLISILAGIFVSSFYTFTRKKIWEGDFQIVLAKENSNLTPSSPFNFNLIDNNTSLKTEVEILKSPSVLMPVFEFVKNKKITQSKNYKEWRYSSWVNSSLKVNLIKGTSVLNLSYKDSNKDLIIPTLDLISSLYQEYSYSDKSKEIENGILYLKDQILIYNEKSKNSRFKAQEFAVSQKLGEFYSEENIDGLGDFKINVERTRIQASDDIKRIDSLLKQLKFNEKDKDSFLYLARLIPEVKKTGVPQAIQEIDFLIANGKRKYVAKDKKILELNDQRERMINLLQEQTYRLLEAERQNASANLESSLRPEGVISKYKELLRKAKIDERTLLQLESELRALTLEQAKRQTPWDLITTPTLEQSPVFPRNKRNILIGFLLGLFSGTVLVFFKEYLIGLIYTEIEIRELLNCNVENFSNYSEKELLEMTRLLSNSSILQTNANEIGLLKLGNIDESIFQKFYELLQKLLKSKKIILYTELTSLEKNDVNLIVTSLGKVSRNEIKSLLKIKNLQEINFDNCILI